ncbi:DUF3570 domain-containing protein [Flavobacterium johnsoniae]|jgi:hypothetical protein|uniref:DUF3570 domain-containing protein n=1 Tax=Flavobacterium johnsoniae (strain ATCC 17061 / DSM 2064 / JCM 8514 / BCRC 14874 / CCUG 350202 / NBRC 14942 / NCIMB 11054 / UW101) TaxID=376686 RepID=A5FDE8_FLAJ1|nr:DUF3570 domain-containing protein [Flavobacterium johnsoniae]ABQ06770.1 hypothetical protein Fjoh_3759 [Flavobacterium johnsoniae UW101]OXE97366.1 hypothetical protein B0A63_19065 [Flavobacterium johnsoniae UW101]WQG81399.1 DUF3570 domain-containing protein [Flavobacterium johnsoniae UW101]SHL41170.1 Protein of unknown function [Flavobacterium johnsoniae]
MKRKFITGFALLMLFQAKAQDVPSDSTGYKSRKLKLEEVNLVSSYYKQDGNNSAVTGGIGSEHLTDIANTIDVKLVKYGQTGIKHTFDIEAGIDHYTSASSDRIDLSANSSASSSDNRFYPSLMYLRENEQKGRTIGIGVSSSTEFDYQSFGANISFSQKTRDRNGEFTAKFQTFIDQLKLIAPLELRSPGSEGYDTAGRNTFAGTLSYSQIVNQNLQLLFVADLISQNGYLSLPFHRVYFNDYSVHQEKMPDSRLKIPLGIRASYFLGDAIIIRAYYRYYTDDWSLKAHTADLEIPVKVTQSLSFSPFYRYYTQSGTKYFKGYAQHTAADQYYTSNYDLSKFESSFFGMGMKFTPPNGIFGLKHWNTLEIRYGHYNRTTNMSSDIISLNIKYK